MKANRAKNSFKKAKSSALFLISTVSFVLLAWLLMFGKIKAVQSISSLLKKLPQNDSEFVQKTEDVLGTAVKQVSGGSVKSATQKGSEVFESSEVAEPAREIRDDVKQKIDETFDSAKELPAKEIKVIQRQICKEWLGEEILATPSAQ